MIQKNNCTKDIKLFYVFYFKTVSPLDTVDNRAKSGKLLVSRGQPLSLLITARAGKERGLVEACISFPANGMQL